MSRDDENPNLIPLPGGGNPDLSKEATRRLQESLPQIIEFQIVMAKIHKAKYDALIAEGFTEAQALELCKTVN